MIEIGEISGKQPPQLDEQNRERLKQSYLNRVQVKWLSSMNKEIPERPFSRKEPFGKKMKKRGAPPKIVMGNGMALKEVEST